MATKGPSPSSSPEGSIFASGIDPNVNITTDEDFHLLTWADLQHIILETNRLEQLRRIPSELTRYSTWTADIKSAYGTITNFVLRERLHWTPIDASSAIPTFSHFNHVPFADARDYKILRNDWPYGLEEGIVHLVVWSRTPIATDEASGDVTEESRRVIEAFVQREFVERLKEDESGQNVKSQGRERVLWFKNWVGLQSVRGVDHVHVLVRDPPGGVLTKWLGG